MESKQLAKRQKKGGKLLPAFCNILGIVILLGALCLGAVLTLPRLFGYEMYNVVSGSMEPEIPVGSLIYVSPAEPDKISIGDIIAFQRDNSVVTHRVTENHIVEGEFTVKGDANEKEDMNTIPYAALIGKVDRHYPMLGNLSAVISTFAGKIYLICFAACGAMFNILAGRLRKKYRNDE